MLPAKALVLFLYKPTSICSKLTPSGLRLDAICASVSPFLTGPYVSAAASGSGLAFAGAGTGVLGSPSSFGKVSSAGVRFLVSVLLRFPDRVVEVLLRGAMFVGAAILGSLRLSTDGATLGIAIGCAGTGLASANPGGSSNRVYSRNRRPDAQFNSINISTYGSLTGLVEITFR